MELVVACVDAETLDKHPDIPLTTSRLLRQLAERAMASTLLRASEPRQKRGKKRRRSRKKLEEEVAARQMIKIQSALAFMK
eukprot:40221-Eustigmatos_ZCMA.PRE.1